MDVKEKRTHSTDEKQNFKNPGVVVEKYIEML